MRPLTIIAIAVVGIGIYAALPKTTQTHAVTVACDIPSDLAGTQTGPLTEIDALPCEITDTTITATSRFFGASTNTTTEGSTSRGDADRMSAFIDGGTAPITPDQMAACMQLMTAEIEATTQASATPSPELDDHFRVACDVAVDGSVTSG